MPLIHRPHFRLRCALVSLAVVAPLHFARAQAKSDKPVADSDPVQLSVFEVNADGDRGLLSTNAVSATKDNTPIKEIPGNIYVLNSGFLRDQIPFDLNDILRFAPGINVDGDYRNETYQIRGFTGGFPLADGFTISRSFPTEQAAVERVEILQGPAGILYGNVSGVGGIVNRIMKKPSFRPSTSLSVSLRGDEDNARVVLDSTGPLGQSQTLAYRVIAAVQHTDGFLDYMKIDRQFVRPSLLWKISPQTKLTVEPDLTLQRTVIGYDYDYFDRSANGKIIRIPRSSNPAESYWHTNSQKYSMMTTFTHEFNRDWVFRASTFTTANFLYDDDPRVGTALNSDNRTIARAAGETGYTKGYLTQQERYVGNYYLQADLAGRVTWADILFRPVTGVEWKLDPNQTYIRRTTTGLGDIANSPFDLFTPQYNQYPYPTGIVPYNQQQSLTDARSAYINDQANLFNNRLKLVAGIRFIKSTTSSRDRIRQDTENAAAAKAGRAPVDTITYGHSNWDHTIRYGFVYDLTTSLAAYAGYSESYEARTTTDNVGNIYPPGLGKQKEAGIKTGFWDGRVTSTISYYEIKQVNNVLTYATGAKGPNGETTAAIGQVEAKGWDVSGVVTVTDAFQLLPGYSRTLATTLVGGSITATAATSIDIPVSKYPHNVVKMYGRYSFKTGILKGLSLNGGFIYTDQVNEGVLSGAAPFPTTNRSNSIIPSSTLWNLGAGYTFSEHWSLAAKVDNLTNLHYYIPSASNTTRALVGLPRVVSVDVNYKF